MVRSISAGVAGFESFPMMPISIGLFASVVALVSLCAKHYRAAKAAKKMDHHSGNPESEFIRPRSPVQSGGHTVPYEPWDYEPDSKPSPRSPLASPKAFLKALSAKAIPVFLAKRAVDHEPKADETEDAAEEGVWKRKILMGERCQPPDFSGAIYYDHTGKRVPELPPRSPRGSSPLADFSFPIINTQESAKTGK